MSSLIEDLKRSNSLDEKTQRELAIKKTVEEKHALEITSQHKKAEDYYSISAFPSLLKRVKDEVFKDLDFGELKLKEPDSNYRIRIVWGEEVFDDAPGPFYVTSSLKRYKRILIMFSPTGDVWVQGNILGRSYFSEKSWKDNPAVQEKALSKAFRHPAHENHPFNRPGYI